MEKRAVSLTEADITKQIRDMLRSLRVMHVKIWQGLMSEKGISDIVGVHNGRFFAIEIKTAKGKVSEHQERFLQRVRDAGGIAIVARCCEDVVEALELKVELWPLFERDKS